MHCASGWKHSKRVSHETWQLLTHSLKGAFEAFLFGEIAFCDRPIDDSEEETSHTIRRDKGKKYEIWR